MPAQPAGPSSGEVAAEAGSLLVGLGILTFTIFPVALPGLLLVVVPAVLVGVAGALLAAPLVLALWLVRTVRRARSRRRDASGPPIERASGAAIRSEPGALPSRG